MTSKAYKRAVRVCHDWDKCFDNHAHGDYNAGSEASKSLSAVYLPEQSTLESVTCSSTDEWFA